MQCVICKRGTVTPVEAEVCEECGEAYYSVETMRYLDQVRDNFVRKVISPPPVGHVYQV